MTESKDRDIKMFLLGVISSLIASFVFFHLMKSRTSIQTQTQTMNNLENKNINVNTLSSDNTSPNLVGYKNTEKRNIIRDKDGRISSIEVIRDAKITK